MQLSQPLTKNTVIHCPKCGKRILCMRRTRRAGETLTMADVRYLTDFQPLRDPTYCQYCGEPWINRATGKVFPKKPYSVSVTQKRHEVKFKSSKDNAQKADGSECRKQKPFRSLIAECEKQYSERHPLRIQSKAEREKLFSEFKKLKSEIMEYLEQHFKPITGPGIAEMLKSDKVNRRTGYTADSIIIDECKPLTKKQIKSANDSLNRMNAKKPTNKRGAR